MYTRIMTTKQPRPRLSVGQPVYLAPHVRCIPASGDRPLVGHDTELRVSSLSGKGTKGHPWLVSVTASGAFLHFDPSDLTTEMP